MNEEGSLEPLTEQSFDTEDRLQTLIADHPELLDGEQIRPGDPRRWLLVTREKGIADAPDSGNRWSVDHLMIDQDAVPTFVEVKRSSNSEIRRSVVGQMLDYAAHATKTMGMAAIRRDFEADHDDNADDALLEFLQPDADANQNAIVEAFWDRLAINLAAKRVRLLFVADRIPNELARVVEFLNSCAAGDWTHRGGGSAAGGWAVGPAHPVDDGTVLRATTRPGCGSSCETIDCCRRGTRRDCQPQAKLADYQRPIHASRRSAHRSVAFPDHELVLGRSQGIHHRTGELG